MSFNRKCRWVVALLSIGVAFHASARPLTGPEIFKKQCAKCHGKNGEGVKGKFEGPLQGERSLEKLTRLEAVLQDYAEMLDRLIVITERTIRVFPP